MDRPSTVVLLAAGVGVLDGLTSRLLAYLPAVLFAGGAPAGSVGPALAAASLSTVLVSPLGALLGGYATADAFDVTARLPATAAVVFVVGYLATVVGLVLGAGFAPPTVDPAGSFLAQLFTGAIRGLEGATVLTVAVVGGAALGRDRAAA